MNEKDGWVTNKIMHEHEGKHSNLGHSNYEGYTNASLYDK